MAQCHGSNDKLIQADITGLIQVMCGLNGHELELVRLVGFFMVSIK